MGLWTGFSELDMALGTVVTLLLPGSTNSEPSETTRRRALTKMNKKACKSVGITWMSEPVHILHTNNNICSYPSDHLAGEPCRALKSPSLRSSLIVTELKAAMKLQWLLP